MNSDAQLPPDDLKGTWCAGCPTAETFTGCGNFWWEAVLDFLAEDDWDEDTDPTRTVEVGLSRPPAAPETLLRASRFLDHIRDFGHDDYLIEGCDCEDWLNDVTPEQEAELENALRAEFGKWLTKHDLLPGWLVLDERIWTVTAAQAAEAQAHFGKPHPRSAKPHE